jgi:hypothetical protein
MTYTVGDEIHFKGYRVAILTEDAPPSVMADFEHGINNATLFEHEEVEQEKVDKKLSEDFSLLYDKVTKISRGGLLRLSDLAKLLELEGYEVK